MLKIMHHTQIRSKVIVKMKPFERSWDLTETWIMTLLFLNSMKYYKQQDHYQ